MSDKTVQERVSVLENDAEHINASLTRIERMLIDIRSDFLKNQARNYADLSATRRELEQDIEWHREETAANLANLETRFKESIGESASNLSEFKKETAANFAKSDSSVSELEKEPVTSFAKTDANFKRFLERMEKIYSDFRKDPKEQATATESTQSQFDVEVARHKTKARWIGIPLLTFLGLDIADSIGLLSLIGKLFSGG